METRKRFLMWYGNILTAYNLTVTEAVILFFIERFGKSLTIKRKSLALFMDMDIKNFPRNFNDMIRKGVLESWEVGKTAGGDITYTIKITDDAYNAMQLDYQTKLYTFRCELLFRQTCANLSMADKVVIACIRSLQKLKGFRISAGSIAKYTGLSKRRVKDILTNPILRKRLLIVKKNVGKLKPLYLYRIKRWHEESLFLTPYHIADKIFSVAQELVKRKEADRRVRSYVLRRINQDWENDNTLNTLQVARYIADNKKMSDKVLELYGNTINYIMQRGIEVHGLKLSGKIEN